VNASDRRFDHAMSRGRQSVTVRPVGHRWAAAKRRPDRCGRERPIARALANRAALPNAAGGC
jgi:hypothetical protein